jgi:NADH-quinone oxidoreductase subunit L
VLAAEAVSSGWFLENAWLIPVVPGVAFALILLFGKRIGRPVGHGAYIGIASMATSLVLSAGAAYQWIRRVDSVQAEEGEHALRALGRSVTALFAAQEVHHAEPFVAPLIKTWPWWQVGGEEFTIGTQVDGLAVTLLFVVSFISLLVQIYSLEYLRGDRRYTHYFAAITLFSAGMLLMVVAESTVEFILGWEIMGLCSFLLIGHWWEDEANARAALKAFFTVRVGDVGLLVGLSVLFFASNGWISDHLGGNGFSIAGINAWALSGDGTAAVVTVAAAALFIAAIGKSGQFPLHTWLPDAMAGPTPVSSLLHSSTMVVAGVYLVARFFPVFHQGFDIAAGDFNVIALIAGITILIAALLAFVQVDIKRVLAYSTISQLGYMMLGLGVGAWLPAVFHIFTHAFFKAGLFLCAGSVSHSGSHHSFDMKKDMGGLRKSMPITFWCWIVCSLALAGFFPFAGFFSKDEIIDNAGHNGFVAFAVIGLVGAFLTAAYMTRATYLTFFGEPRGAAAGLHDEHDVLQAAHGEPDAVHAMVGAEAPDAAVAADEAAGVVPAVVDHGHDTHRGPHESNWLITVPITILAICAALVGFSNATPFGDRWERFQGWVEPGATAVALGEATAEPGEPVVVPAEGEVAATEEAGCGVADPAEGTACYFPTPDHAEFSWAKAAVSLLVAAAGVVVSWVVCVNLYTRRNRALVGLTQRSRLLGSGYRFLWNKYYLDWLYESVIVHAIAHPIARAMYWINQNVIDAVVNAIGRISVAVSTFTYKYIDQGVVDRVVNGSGKGAEESGRALQPVQSGRVSQYGALLFGAAAVGALILVLTV